MQYLIQDLIKLPLSERISIVETIIQSIGKDDYEAKLIEAIQDKIQNQEYQSISNQCA